MSYKIFEYDPYLKPYEKDIELRMENYRKKKAELLEGCGEKSLCDFAQGHKYFGFIKAGNGWFYREWAPAAEEMYLTGDFNGWNRTSHPLKNIGNGVWEIFLKGSDTLYDGCHVRTLVKHDGRMLERIPLYIRRVEQDRNTNIWCGVIEDKPPYIWRNRSFRPQKHLYIYECHIGMAQEKEAVGTYDEFSDNILPRIKTQGYNAIQIMALAEHPYYGSFGYQVSSFFAPSSRYGDSDGLKRLIDKAHGLGIAVFFDIVHSHAIKNTAEGINEFDGTSYQFFHEGGKGDHPAWGTKLFNYGKNEVIHFLLSNIRYWTEEFRFDGFRFDGVTSMIYHDHGLGSAFTDYGKYFSLNTDTEAITYLQLACEVAHGMNKNAVLIAEDMSAMPGMCLPPEDGGIGFDYRLAMGIPDLWINLIRDCKDEFWDMGRICHELTSRRPHEKYIGYCESHDQALVGDKTIIFRLCDSAMYTDMSKDRQSAVIDRGIALANMIKIITLTLGGEGYLNFMGNEFGHPEWIDFPREGNNWSYFYCRRQWHLADDRNLRYCEMLDFDKDMIALAKKHRITGKYPRNMYADSYNQTISFSLAGLTFAFNFSPLKSQKQLKLRVPGTGKYRVILSSDNVKYGGTGRISESYIYSPQKEKDGYYIYIYLPVRTCLCLAKIKDE